MAEEVRDQSRGGGLSVGPGDGDDGDAVVRAGREEHVENWRGDVAGLPLGGMRVHPDAGRGVHLDDDGVVVAEGDRDVVGEDVDPGDVEPDHAGGDLARRHVVGVDLLGPVDRGAAGGQVRRRSQQHAGALVRHGVQRVALVREVAPRVAVDRKARQRLPMPDPAARIAVLALDELADGAPAIADHVRRHALGHRDHPSVDDEHAVIAPGREPLDDRLARDGARLGPRGAHGVGVIEATGDAAPVVGVERLHDHGKAELLRDGDGVVFARGDLADGHGKPHALEHALGVALVLRDLDRDGARVVGHRRLDAAQVAAGAELDERTGVEPPHGDAAATRLLDDGGGGRSEPHLFVQVVERVEEPVHVDRLAGDARAEHPHAVADGLQPDLLLLVRDDHPPHAGVARLDDPAKAHVGADEGLELERDVLEDVGQVRSFDEALDEAARRTARAGMLMQRREQARQALDEARNVGRGDRIEVAERDVAGDDGREAPVVGPAQRAKARDAQILGAQGRGGNAAVLELGHRMGVDALGVGRAGHHGGARLARGPPARRARDGRLVRRAGRAVDEARGGRRAPVLVPRRLDGLARGRRLGRSGHASPACASPGLSHGPLLARRRRPWTNVWHKMDQSPAGQRGDGLSCKAPESRATRHGWSVACPTGPSGKTFLMVRLDGGGDGGTRFALGGGVVGQSNVTR